MISEFLRQNAVAVMFVLGMCCGCSLGLVVGLWRSNRKDIAIYRDGQQAGYNHAKSLYAVRPADVPTLRQPSVAPFAGRERI
jgi:hypothetical protein